MRRRIGLVLVVVALIALGAYGAAHALTGSSGIARSLAWGEPDIDDRNRFPAQEIVSDPVTKYVPRARAP